MITKFVTVYPGHIDLGDMGQDTTPANERRYSNDQLAGVFEKTEAIAKTMDTLGYDTLWLAEHHFQHEGYECIPNLLMLAVHLAHVTKRLRIGCGFNIAPDVAPAAARRGLCGGRHPHQGPHRVRRGPRLPHARGRDLRRTHAGPERQPRAVRGAGRDHLQGLQHRVLLAQRQALHAPPRGALSRLHPEGADAGAAPGQPARRMLAARRQRQTRAGSTSWCATASRARSAAAPPPWRRVPSRPIAMQPHAPART